MKQMKNSIAARIKIAFSGLAGGLCVVFLLIIFMLIYVIEDKVFINQLRAQQDTYEGLTAAQAQQWTPSNAHMNIYYSDEALDSETKQSIGQQFGIYEHFKDDQAMFTLFSQRKDTQQPYYIQFDVSELLAVRNNRTSLLIGLGIAAFILIALSVAIAYWVAGKMLKPLKQLTQQINQKNAPLPENFAQPFAGDEIGILATALQSSMEETRKIAQREYAFNKGVSHELRTPLQVAQNALELMSLNENVNHKQVVERLNRAVEKMKLITEAFLWLASDKSKQHNDTSIVPFDAKKTAKQITKQYGKEFPAHPIKFVGSEKTLYYPKTPKHVFIVIFENLIQNALKHGANGTIICELTNNHINIKNKVRKTQKDNGGYGIGLTIVSHFCEMLGWTFSTRQTKDGQFIAELTICSD